MMSSVNNVATKINDHTRKNPTCSLKNGNLTINGGKGNDDIKLVRKPGVYPAMVQVMVNGAVVMTVSSAKLKSVTIHGGAGNDRISIDHSLSLNTTIYGGSGNDTILGGSGRDVIFGGSGNDRINGGAGNDLLFGNTGNDTLIGGSGADKITGGDGEDQWTYDGVLKTFTDNFKWLKG